MTTTHRSRRLPRALLAVLLGAGLTAAAAGCTNGDDGGAINGPGGGHVTTAPTAPPTSK